MRIYITFGDEKYKRTRDFGVWTAIHFGGFDKAVAYTPDDIEYNFKKEHEDIFCIKRGYGLWLWKPYLIYKTLNEMCQEGDYLFYGDGGSFLIRDIKFIERSMNGSDIWVSHIPLLEWQFTKRDAFDIMGCNGNSFERTPQIQGGFLYIRKTKESVRFVKDWLSLCCDIRLLHPDNIFSKQENVEGFHSHREDQSVLSLLCKKKEIVPHQDPSQYGKYPQKYWQEGYMHVKDTKEREYPVLLILHRTPNVNIKICLKQLVLTILPKYIGLKFISYVKR